MAIMKVFNILDPRGRLRNSSTLSDAVSSKMIVRVGNGPTLDVTFDGNLIKICQRRVEVKTVHLH